MILEKLRDNPKQQPAKVTAAFGYGRSRWPHYLVVA
jgi:hypothetical protein